MGYPDSVWHRSGDWSVPLENLKADLANVTTRVRGLRNLLLIASAEKLSGTISAYKEPPCTYITPREPLHRLDVSEAVRSQRDDLLPPVVVAEAVPEPLGGVHAEGVNYLLGDSE
jgi:hypothetical protein